MPKKKRNEYDLFIIAILDTIVTLWFIVFYGGYLLIKSLITHRPIEKHSLAQQKAFKRSFVGIIIIIGLAVIMCIAFPPARAMFIFFALVFLIPLTIILIKKRQRRQAITSNIDSHLKKALETMDTTAKWYNNEEEANRELVSCLKAQGINDVHYQYRLSNGRTVDAKVGDVLIEGKLSPDTSEIDRLIGQLSDYTHYGNRLNVVIYGYFNKEARRRIEDVIHTHYLNKVFLTYINNPRRNRSEYAS